MNRTLYFFSLFLISANFLFANKSVHYLTENDTVWIKIDPDHGNYFEHEVKPKQTLYSLSKFYGVDMLSIFDQNPYLKEEVLGVNDIVKVAIHNTLIQTVKPQNVTEYAPVYYKVNKKDNLFRIARRYFDLPVKKLMEHNQLEDYNLDIGQPLLIGWIPLEGARNAEKEGGIAPQDQENLMGPFEIKYQVDQILASKPEDNPSKEELKVTVENPGSPESDEIKPPVSPIKNEIAELKNSFEEKQETPSEEKIKLSYFEERGVAHWSRDIKHKTDLYVLHKSAPVGSTVQVTNPIINKSIYAKVIAPLPESMYPEKVKVIVSPAVANLLGAVDAQFFVKVKYLAPEN